MLRCSVKYSKPSDLAFPSVHRLSEHATAAQDDLHPAEKKTWPNTEHPWNGAIHKECLKKMRPTIFPCSCCCHNFKEPSKYTMVSPPLFWLQFQPTIKTKPQQKKNVLNTTCFFFGEAPPNFDALPFEHHKPDPLCYLPFRCHHLSKSNLSSSKITPILERLVTDLKYVKRVMMF